MKQKLILSLSLAVGLAMLISCSAMIECLTDGYPEDFVFVPGKTVRGAVSGSSVFIDGRTVKIPDMCVCEHEVTQQEYELYCGYGERITHFVSGYACSRADFGEGENYPAYNVSWYDAIVYCNLRSIAEGLTPVYKIGTERNPVRWDGIQCEDGKYFGPTDNNDAWNNMIYDTDANGYRLPTEAEWEYIATNRNTDSYTYAGNNRYEEVAWVRENARAGKRPGVPNYGVNEIKRKKPNGLGVYDMSGNVWEWCWDFMSTITAQTPCTGADSGTFRVKKGSSWRFTASNASIYRTGNCYRPYVELDDDFDRGFRVVRTMR